TLDDAVRAADNQNVKVLIAQIGPDDVEINLPTRHKFKRLRGNFKETLSSEVFDFTGRFQYTVAQPGQENGTVKRMGQAIRVSNIKVNTDYEVRPLSVNGNHSPFPITLSGGEDYRFIFGENGIRPDRKGIDSVVEGFGDPQTTDGFLLGNDKYRVGRITGSAGNIRFAFANLFGPSRYPNRVWGLFSESGNEKAFRFDVFRPTREFANGVPTYDFLMPDRHRMKKVDLTLFVKPPDKQKFNLDESDRMLKIEGIGKGEFKGLKYEITRDGPVKYQVKVMAENGIHVPIHVACPDSVPVEEGGSAVVRTVEFEGSQRISETFQFEVPESRAGLFRCYLFASTSDEFEQWMQNGLVESEPTQVQDPVFGDLVIAIRFKNIELKK
ncbi:MAG: hypothetical protein AAF939_22870, partial [Planctomycetota bacterium]